MDTLRTASHINNPMFISKAARTPQEAGPKHPASWLALVNGDRISNIIDLCTSTHMVPSRKRSFGQIYAPRSESDTWHLINRKKCRLVYGQSEISHPTPSNARFNATDSNPNTGPATSSSAATSALLTLAVPLPPSSNVTINKPTNPGLIEVVIIKLLYGKMTMQPSQVLARLKTVIYYMEQCQVSLDKCRETVSSEKADGFKSIIMDSLSISRSDEGLSEMSRLKTRLSQYIQTNIFLSGAIDAQYINALIMRGINRILLPELKDLWQQCTTTTGTAISSTRNYRESDRGCTIIKSIWAMSQKLSNLITFYLLNPNHLLIQEGVVQLYDHAWVELYRRHHLKVSRVGSSDIIESITSTAKANSIIDKLTEAYRALLPSFNSRSINCSYWEELTNCTANLSAAKWHLNSTLKMYGNHLTTTFQLDHMFSCRASRNMKLFLQLEQMARRNTETQQLHCNLSTLYDLHDILKLDLCGDNHTVDTSSQDYAYSNTASLLGITNSKLLKPLKCLLTFPQINTFTKTFTRYVTATAIAPNSKLPNLQQFKKESSVLVSIPYGDRVCLITQVLKGFIETYCQHLRSTMTQNVLHNMTILKLIIRTALAQSALIFQDLLNVTEFNILQNLFDVDCGPSLSESDDCSYTQSLIRQLSCIQSTFSHSYEADNLHVGYSLEEFNSCDAHGLDQVYYMSKNDPHSSLHSVFIT